MKRAVRNLLALVTAFCLSACGASSGIIPVGPNTYSLYEMRSEALGGGARAHEIVLAEAAGFCRQQGRAVAVLVLSPGGDPRGYYWPTAFNAIFECLMQGGHRVRS